MINEKNYQPSGNSDDSNGNDGDFKPKRQRITTSGNNRSERGSFNPNFYNENRTYRASTRVENGENSSENRPYNPSPRGEGYGNRSNNYERQPRPYNRDNNGSERSSYSPNRENRGYNSEGRSYNSENRGYNSDRGNYQPRENRYNSGERKPYNSYNNNGGERKSYNNYNNNGNGERKPYNNYNSGSGERRPYNNYNSDSGERKPYGNFNRDNSQGGGYRPRSNDGGGYGNRNYGDKFSRDRNYNPNDKYSQKKQIEYKKQFVDLSLPMRLNKFLANSSTCSRREADEFITAGVVSVNGKVITELGTKIIPSMDKVHFHDQLVSIEKKVYILLNKPKNCVTTSDDPQERLTVLDLVKGACSERIYPVGRLDRNTTGVILLTNDGDLTSKLTHPKYDKKKIYQIKLDRDLEDNDLKQLLSGIVLEDGEMKADEVSFVNDDDYRTVGIEIHSGKNRIVRRMFEHLNYRIIALDRVYFAGLTKKNLPRGKWRYLSESEVNILKMSN
ncbi:MAG: pseudouridine synthase [Prevotellaceae bacterium]|nr:pseudouridine synthase [Prevotellaceae bacterium]